MRIYGDIRSGNCLKVKYLCDFLAVPYEWVAIDIMAGESRTAEFLAKNPQGQVPLLQRGDGRCLGQSNAILRYLASGSTLLPGDPFELAKVDEWLFWEQYSHEPYVAVCRFQMIYLGKPSNERETWRVERAELALDFLERALSERSWLVGDAFTIADIALLAYTRLAPEGGFNLDTRPNLKRWVALGEDTLGIG